jgi:hypothetical protein
LRQPTAPFFKRRYSNYESMTAHIVEARHTLAVIIRESG